MKGTPGLITGLPCLGKPPRLDGRPTCLFSCARPPEPGPESLWTGWVGRVGAVAKKEFGELVSLIAIVGRLRACALAALIAASWPAANAYAFDIDVSVIQADPAANPSGYRVMLKALSPGAGAIAPDAPDSWSFHVNLPMGQGAGATLFEKFELSLTAPGPQTAGPLRFYLLFKDYDESLDLTFYPTAPVATADADAEALAIGKLGLDLAVASNNAAAGDVRSFSDLLQAYQRARAETLRRLAANKTDNPTGAAVYGFLQIARELGRRLNLEPGEDVIAARDWLARVAAKPPAGISPADAKSIVAAIDALKYRPLGALWQAIQDLSCADGGLEKMAAYFTYLAGLPADQIGAIAKATGITPAGVVGAGNSCAARIALEGKIDKDKIKLLIAGQIELDKKALSVVGNDGAAKLRRDMNYLAGFR